MSHTVGVTLTEPSPGSGGLLQPDSMDAGTAAPAPRAADTFMNSRRFMWADLSPNASRSAQAPLPIDYRR
jgi:hypothetical protein